MPKGAFCISSKCKSNETFKTTTTGWLHMCTESCLWVPNKSASSTLKKHFRSLLRRSAMELEWKHLHIDSGVLRNWISEWKIATFLFFLRGAHNTLHLLQSLRLSHSGRARDVDSRHRRTRKICFRPFCTHRAGFCVSRGIETFFHRSLIVLSLLIYDH